MSCKSWKAIARKMGFNLTGEDSWDGVEMHLRIFGHLPEDEGCYRYSCLKEEAGGYEKVEKFLQGLVEEAMG